MLGTPRRRGHPRCLVENITIHEAASLPYGGDYHGLEGALRHGQGFRAAWDRFQPHEARGLNPRIVADDDHVVVLWHHKVENAVSGDRLELPAVSVYRMENAKIANSRMFHFDTAALLHFLERNVASSGRMCRSACDDQPYACGPFLPLSHFLIASTRLRRLSVRRFGEQRYLASYSTLTLATFAGLIVAYLRAPVLVVWTTPAWLAALLLPVILVGSVLLVSGLSTPNPVVVNLGHLLDQADIARGILRVSRNPFFWGAGLVSLAQVIVLGDVAAILAFGSIAFLGILGRSCSTPRRRART